MSTTREIDLYDLRLYAAEFSTAPPPRTSATDERLAITTNNGHERNTTATAMRSTTPCERRRNCKTPRTIENAAAPRALYVKIKTQSFG